MTATDTPRRLRALCAAALVGLAAALPATADARVCPPQIVVHPGDTLSRIAHACGVSVHAMLRANPQVTHPSVIFAGEVLNVPRPYYRPRHRRVIVHPAPVIHHPVPVVPYVAPAPTVIDPHDW
ncbi:MAG: LysM domain-containing protein [Paracoccaceae bacterium]